MKAGHRGQAWPCVTYIKSLMMWWLRGDDKMENLDEKPVKKLVSFSHHLELLNCLLDAEYSIEAAESIRDGLDWN